MDRKPDNHDDIHRAALKTATDGIRDICAQQQAKTAERDRHQAEYKKRERRRVTMSYGRHLPILFVSPPWVVAKYVWPLLKDRFRDVSAADTKLATAGAVGLVGLVVLWDLVLIVEASAMILVVLAVLFFIGVMRDLFSGALDSDPRPSSGSGADAAAIARMDKKMKRMTEPWHSNGSWWFE